MVVDMVNIRGKYNIIQLPVKKLRLNFNISSFNKNSKNTGACIHVAVALFKEDRTRDCNARKPVSCT